MMYGLETLGRWPLPPGYRAVVSGDDIELLHPGIGEGRSRFENVKASLAEPDYDVMRHAWRAWVDAIGCTANRLKLPRGWDMLPFQRSMYRFEGKRGGFIVDCIGVGLERVWALERARRRNYLEVAAGLVGLLLLVGLGLIIIQAIFASAFAPSVQTWTGGEP